jgi:hypothetical protein
MTNLKQMELIKSTSSPEDTLANLSPSQVEKKVKKIQDTSGQKCLDLSKNSDLLGSLEKNVGGHIKLGLDSVLENLESEGYSARRLVFQLLASVPTTKEKESGLWPTPTRCNDVFTWTKVGRDRAKGPKPKWDGQKELEREESSDQLDHCGEGCTKCQSCQTMANSEGSEGMSMTLTEGMAKLHKKSYLESTVAQVESAPGGQLNPCGSSGSWGTRQGGQT